MMAECAQCVMETTVSLLIADEGNEYQNGFNMHVCAGYPGGYIQGPQGIQRVRARCMGLISVLSDAAQSLLRCRA
jgi:hypothetical protein